jgi:shikimate 5-dehydrogenase
MACNVRGVDIALDADDETYVRFLRDLLTDDSAAGAVITTHKVGLFRAGRILFAGLDPLALACEEVNAIRRTPDGLRGWARDPVSVGRVADQIWPESEGEVVCLGAGGPRDSSAPIRSAPPSSTSLARRKASSPDTSAMGLGMTSSKLRRPGR